MAKLPDYHEKTEFRIESPKGKSKSFRIRYKSPKTGDKWTILKLPEIDLANKLMKKGVATPEHTRAKLKGILAQQYQRRDRRKKQAEYMSSNLKLIERMWEEKYPKRVQRKMKRPDESWRDLERAVEAAGLFPLDTCNLEELADWLDSSIAANREKFPDPEKAKRVMARRITWINSILTWLGRPTLDALNGRSGLQVTYLTEAEFHQLLTRPSWAGDTKRYRHLLAWIGFYTGLRLGEIFYVQPRHIREDHIFVEMQMTDIKEGDHFKLDTPKSGQTREAILPEITREKLMEWATIPLHDREKWRLKAFAKYMERGCAKLWPNDPVKHCNFHALRHCNAIWLLSKGAEIHEVAQHLGNRLEVTEQFYSGFRLKRASISRLKTIVDTDAGEKTAK